MHDYECSTCKTWRAWLQYNSYYFMRPCIIRLNAQAVSDVGHCKNMINLVDMYMQSILRPRYWHVIFISIIYTHVINEIKEMYDVKEIDTSYYAPG